MLKVNLSKGNSKMGKVMSVSLPPIKSCGAALPCFKGCYAAKLSRLRPVVRAAWENNWRMVMTGRDEYFYQIVRALKEKPPAMFRWHVAGDIVDGDYLTWMVYIALNFPEVRFLAFTKKAELVWRHKADIRHAENLSVVLSMWPGLEVPAKIVKAFPTAWMRDRKVPDPRIPADAVTCGGNCEACTKCWGMKAGGAVVFDRH